MRVRFLLGAHFDGLSAGYFDPLRSLSVNFKNFMQDLLLQKRTKKKKVISAAVLITSAYASVLFTGGLVLGYLGMRFFYNRYVKNDPSKFMYVSIKGWKIHLHHWISASLIIVYLALGGWKLGAHEIFLGILCGIIAHDIYDFNDWHQVVARERRTV